MHGLIRQAELRIPFTPIRFFTDGRTWAGPYRDSYDYTHLLQKCKGTKCVKKLHCQIITGGYEQNRFVASKLVGKYCESSNMGYARKVFDSLFERDIFLWNLIIQGYANMGPNTEAVSIYSEMRLAGICVNQYTYPFVLKACGVSGDKKNGQVIHGHVVKSGLDTDLFVGNALVAFYAKCQEVDMSRKVFDAIPQRDLVSWNSMISSYAVNGYADAALTLFRAMLRDPATCAPDNATLVTVLPACAQAAAIQLGFWIHSYIIKTSMEIDAALGSGLISMYANCGRVNIARDVFDRVSDKNIVVWNAIIRCYGMHGYADEAIQMFSRLTESGLQPDGLIFLCLLSACSHAGMVEKGRELFARMEDYAVEKNEEHYACMVDIIGRAGYLEEAVAIIETMPVKPRKNVYGALLGACRIHNNIELAEEAAERLFVLDPDNAGRYIILAKMYEDAERWEDSARVRKLLRERKIKKPIGCSSIEVDCVHHTFGVEDESHPCKDQIFDALERLDRIMGDELVEM
ncbi:pentatricopeptide repeat-containing protein At3g46790, chloroplastic [Manihot esculenta]|uniref:Pentatricopeptide repeat-containing protein n=1 Tax=Manihot esculenta TaxID=3983 RepID=A0A2C9WCU4_MANES|nr:pentatricopeptide repeat-containing protein At3g46790, chloroplastic [Manihot esculenta]OAY57615.1 hypothetical protein MANES_02G110700v8 [Manihot esculenta]